MREYKDLLATVSEMEISSPKPSVNYVQMEIGAGESLSIDSPRSYPKLLNEVAGFDTGFQLPKQRKVILIVQPQQPKPPRQAVVATPPPQPKVSQPLKPAPTLELSPAQPQPAQPNKPAFRFFNRSQKPAQPSPQPKPQPQIAAPQPVVEKEHSSTLEPSAPEGQKPAPQKQWIMPGFRQREPKAAGTVAPQPVQKEPITPPKAAPQPKSLEDSVAKELKELTKTMKAEETKSSAPIQQVYAGPPKDLVLPRLSLTDQVSELDKIVENLAQRRFDDTQMAIVKDEVRGLAEALSSQPQPAAAQSPFERDLMALRKARLAEALELIKGL